LELSSEGRGDLEEHVKQVRREEAMGKEVLPEGITLVSSNFLASRASLDVKRALLVEIEGLQACFGRANEPTEEALSLPLSF